MTDMTDMTPPLASGSLGMSAAASAESLAGAGRCMSHLGLLDITSPLGEGLRLYLLIIRACLN